LIKCSGNNGSTVTASILANKHSISWETKEGTQYPNYYGSLTQSSTIDIGSNNSEKVHVPFSSLVPFADPNELVIGGWDISNLNLADSMVFIIYYRNVQKF
jgi:myo-inositol-1-phosphate synthase